MIDFFFFLHFYNPAYQQDIFI